MNFKNIRGETMGKTNEDIPYSTKIINGCRVSYYEGKVCDVCLLMKRKKQTQPREASWGTINVCEQCLSEKKAWLSPTTRKRLEAVGKALTKEMRKMGWK